MSQESVVVVGAGLAGSHVVTTLREEGYAGPVTLVGDEPEPPYERPPLSKGFLQGTDPFEDAVVHPVAWYAEHDVELRLGTRAAAIDRAAHEVGLATGERLGYGQLVLATGSAARTLDVPGADLAGVRTLRSVADSRALKETLGPGVRLVVVGGGWTTAASWSTSTCARATRTCSPSATSRSPATPRSTPRCVSSTGTTRSGRGGSPRGPSSPAVTPTTGCRTSSPTSTTSGWSTWGAPAPTTTSCCAATRPSGELIAFWLADPAVPLDEL